MKKIPDNAKKVFEGVLFDVYQWDQEMFDGSFATFEALKKRSSVTVLGVTLDNHIIVNDEEQPVRGKFIALPGGLCEKDATPIENAKREFLEETGYTFSSFDTWFVTDPLHYAKMEWDNHFFIAKGCTKIADQQLDPGEKIQTHLYSFDEFLELRTNPEFRNKDLIPILDKAVNSEEEKQKLKDLLGISP